MHVAPEINETEFNRMLDWAATQLEDPHSRYHSWEHAYRNWKKYANESGHRLADLTALHLAFYLASWGMLRGSSALLQRDYKVFLPIVKLLKRHSGNGWGDCMFRQGAGYEPDELADSLVDLRGQVADALHAIPPTPPPENTRVSATDTLVSKILLNTLACVPAWDQNVRRALSRVPGIANKGSNGFSRRFLREFIEFARANQGLLEAGQSRLYEVRGFRFPLTRILDLHLWYTGR
jgi:hypothetical protein